jgi:hypothetical protein
MSRLGPLLALVLILAACGGGTLNAESFRKEAESVQSFAAEGALLARDIADGKSLSPYVRVHAGELAKDAETLARRLERAKGVPALRAKLPRASRLAARVAVALKKLEAEPGDRTGARRLQGELEDVAHSAEELASA